MTNEQAIIECLNFWSNGTMGHLISGFSTSVVAGLARRGVIVLRHGRSPNDPPDFALSNGVAIPQSSKYLAFLTLDPMFLKTKIGSNTFGFRNNRPHTRVNTPSGYLRMYCLVRQHFIQVDLNKRCEMFAFFPTSVVPYNGKLTVDGEEIEVDNSEILNKEQEILLTYMKATVGQATAVQRFNIINDRLGEPTERFEMQLMERYKDELRERIVESKKTEKEKLKELKLENVERKDVVSIPAINDVNTNMVDGGYGKGGDYNSNE